MAARAQYVYIEEEGSVFAGNIAKATATSTFAATPVVAFRFADANAVLVTHTYPFEPPARYLTFVPKYRLRFLPLPSYIYAPSPLCTYIIIYN